MFLPILLLAIIRESFSVDCIPPQVNDNTQTVRRYTAHEEDTFEPGTILKFKCRTTVPFPAASSFTRRCQEDGSWSEEPLDCQQLRNADSIDICPFPGSPEGGVIEEFEKDSHVSYRCIEGYKMEGSPTRKCDPTTGNYDSEIPKCVAVL